MAEGQSLAPKLVERALNEGFAVWTDGGRTNLDLYLTFADRAIRSDATRKGGAVKSWNEIRKAKPLRSSVRTFP